MTGRHLRGGCRSNREIRRALFERNPHCHWCGCPTRWTQSDGPLPDDAATLDHMGERRMAVVLACYRCNQYRGELKRKSTVGGQALPPLSRLIAESRAWLAAHEAA